MSTRGYIQYGVDSPIYSKTFTIGDKSFNIPTEAIEAGHKVDEVFYTMVAQNKNFYKQYVGYILQGPHDTLLSKAIKDLLVPRVENEEWTYIYILNNTPNVPNEYIVPIIRSLYTYTHVKDRIYRKKDQLSDTEIYGMIMIEGIPLYIGTQGSFLALETSDQDISHALELLNIA